MNIQAIILALLDSGMTQKALAEAVGTTQPTIHRGLHGADIRYSVGRKIELLYEQVSQEKLTPKDQGSIKK